MSDYQDRAGGGVVASHYFVGVLATSIQLVPTNLNRIAARITSVATTVYLGYGVAASGAPTAICQPLASGAVHIERDYLGAITAAAATAASGGVQITDISFA